MKATGFIISMVLLSLVSSVQGFACTGITLKAKDGSTVLARTVEWGESRLVSHYVVVPHGYKMTALTQAGASAMTFEARYGFVGVSVVEPSLVVDGINEMGLAAGLFFFPGYGQYEEYNAEYASSSLPDMQFVSWVLASFASVDEMIDALDDVHIVSLAPEIQSVHWRVADASGRQVVIEIVDKKVRIFENELGVLTNAPGFEWHLLNLNNYVNLQAGTAKAYNLTEKITLKSFGAGSSMLGLPGDVTPPSRFVRAAFYQATAPQYPTAEETVVQAFHILNNFDIPIGVEHHHDDIPSDVMSATQWTTSASLGDLKFYYRTSVNMSIRCIDLKHIDFGSVKYQAHPLDDIDYQPIEYVQVR